MGINKVIQKEAPDWLDQAIKHIMPKKALVYNEINPAGASGKDIYSVIVYDSNFNATGIALKDRSLVFLCPKNEKQKKLLEDFCSTKHDLNSIKSFITQNDSYTVIHNNEKFYKIFAKKKADSEYEWVEGYVKTTNVYPQEFNLQEYMYYRGKINSLLNGETVIFNDEDFDYKISRSQRKKYQNVLVEEIKNVFRYELSTQNLLEETNHLRLIDGIGSYYLNLVKKMKETKEQSYFPNEINSYETKIHNCCNIVFNYDTFLIDDPFTSEDKWLQRGKSSFEKNYKKVCSEVFSETESNERWKLLFIAIQECIRKNVDYYLECNNIIPIGEIGLSGDRTYLHIEIFSEEKIIKSSGYTILKEKKFDNFQNKTKTLKQLKEKFDFNEVFITQNDFLHFYESNRYKLFKTIANIINLNIKLDGTGKLKSDKHKGYTITEIDNFVFIDKHDLKPIGFPKQVAYFYHPIDFINFLNNDT